MIPGTGHWSLQDIKANTPKEDKKLAEKQEDSDTDVTEKGNPYQNPDHDSPNNRRLHFPALPEDGKLVDVGAGVSQ